MNCRDCGIAITDPGHPWQRCVKCHAEWERLVTNFHPAIVAQIEAAVKELEAERAPPEKQGQSSKEEENG